MIISRADGVFWRAAPGFLVLADGDGTLTEIEGAGAEVWAALGEPIEVADLVVALAAAHQVSTEQVDADITPMLAGLIERGLIVRSPP